RARGGAHLVPRQELLTDAAGQAAPASGDVTGGTAHASTGAAGSAARGPHDVAVETERSSGGEPIRRRGSPASIALLAGEPSGDHHGAALARALRQRLPGVRLVGLGGPAMEAEGVELLAGLDDLAVMGFAEVVKRIGFFRKLERRVSGMLV